MAASTPDERTVVVETTTALPRPQAYRAFTDAAVVQQWFWPQRLRARCTVDARVGGEFRVSSDVIGLTATATFREVEDGRRLAADWRWEGDLAVTRIVVTFEDAPDGTRVTVVHTDNPTALMREEHMQGWTDCLARLADLQP